MTTYSTLDEAPDSVRDGIRAVRPREVAVNIEAARAKLAHINESIILGARLFTVHVSLASWLTYRLADAGWEIERTPLNADEETVRLILTSREVSS